jgi:hypothetical protein
MVMSREEDERMHWLCDRIQQETDPKKFDELVMELNELLGRALGKVERKSTDPTELQVLC